MITTAGLQITFSMDASMPSNHSVWTSQLICSSATMWVTNACAYLICWSMNLCLRSSNKPAAGYLSWPRDATQTHKFSSALYLHPSAWTSPSIHAVPYVKLCVIHVRLSWNPMASPGLICSTATNFPLTTTSASQCSLETTKLLSHQVTAWRAGEVGGKINIAISYTIPIEPHFTMLPGLWFLETNLTHASVYISVSWCQCFQMFGFLL